jgi:hypothetical protein
LRSSATPDEWQVSYAVKKRRAGKAPEGSGVPVGTEYHWYILAHQNVTKLNANEYSTSMTGVKFKLAHKRAGQEKWRATERAQCKHLIKILKQIIQDLEKIGEENGDLETPGLEYHKKTSARQKQKTSLRSPR